jgi:hypothetical protein
MAARAATYPIAFKGCSFPFFGNDCTVPTIEYKGANKRTITMPTATAALGPTDTVPPRSIAATHPQDGTTIIACQHLMAMVRRLFTGDVFTQRRRLLRTIRVVSATSAASPIYR